MARVTGRCEIRVNGVLLLSKKGASLQIGGEERKPIVEDQFHGWVGELMPAILTVTVTDRDDVKVEDLINVFEGTATFEAVDGKMYLVEELTAKGNPTVTAGEGAVELEYFGRGPATELYVTPV